jgi:hypothetical protein
MMKTKYLIVTLIIINAIDLVSCIGNSTTPSESVPRPAEEKGGVSPKSSGSDIQINDHDFYPEKQQFTYGIFDPTGRNLASSKEPLTIQAEYIDRDSVDSSDGAHIAYRFLMTDANTQISLLIPADVTDDIRLISGEVYQIISESYPGWPPTYGLIISRDADLLFAGIADWQLDGRINIDDAFFPISNKPITIQQTRVLTDNYIEHRLGESICTTTNTEIIFSSNGKSVTLHQGESAILGDYDVNLLVAREIQWVNPPTDAGQNGISYTITKVSESKPSGSEPAFETAEFSDPALDNAIRQAIGKNTGEITRFDLMELVNLSAPSLNIENISGLEKCLALRWLNLSSNQIEDISPLSELPNLHHIELKNNKISDISPLGNNLKFRNGQLYISGNPLSEESINIYIPQLEKRDIDILDRHRIK